MNERWRRSSASLAACAALAFVSLWIAGPVLATDSWYESHDGMRLPYLSRHFTDAVRHGILYPRWLPDLMSGYGYPTFLFYQPGYFYFTLPFAWFLQPLEAACASLVAALLLGAGGAYRLARLYNTQWVSVLLAVVFLFAPYLAPNIYVRGAYPEAYAMLMVPWAVYFALRFGDALRAGGPAWGPCLGCVGFTAFILLLHPSVALFVLPLIGGLLAVRGFLPSFSARLLLASGMALALVMVITSPYWLTALQLKEHVRYGYAITGLYDPATKGAELALVLPGDPRSLWFWFVALAVAGFAASRRNPVMLYAAGCFFFLAFMITEHARPVWEAGRVLLQYVQFPWRIFAVLTTVAFLGMVQLGPHLSRLYARRRWAGAAVAAAALGLTAYDSVGPFRLLVPVRELVAAAAPQAASWRVFDGVPVLPEVDYDRRIEESEAEGGISMAGTNEFMPRTARLGRLPNRLTEPVPLLQRSESHGGVGSVNILPPTSRYRLLADVTVEEPAAFVINQFYFPGWVASVDDKPVRWLTRARGRGLKDSGLPDSLAGEASYDNRGRMLFSFSRPGTYRLEAYYGGPPGWQWRNACIAALSAVLLALLHALMARPRAPAAA